MPTSTADKGYEADAEWLLRTSPDPALRQLTVQVTDDEIILSGIVCSYYLKQLAQETIMPATGNRKLFNRIQVVSETTFQARPSTSEREAVPLQQVTLSEKLLRVLLHPTGGIVGLVDELLRIGLEHPLQLDWHADSCQVRCFVDGWTKLVDVPLRKSVFRAILARVANLCNERNPNSVSPFGGHSELSVGAKPAAVLRVAFANTTTSQKLELTPGAEDALDD